MAVEWKKIAYNNDVLLKDGTVALTGDWDIGDGRTIQADRIRARDGDGLSLFEDGGFGIFVGDGGYTDFTTQPSCIIYQSSAQSVANNTDTKIALDTTVRDTWSEFSNANDEITVTKAGLYLIIGSVTLESLGVGQWTWLRLRSAAMTYGYRMFHAAVATVCTNNVTILAELAASTAIYMQVKQATGGAINTRPGLEFTTLQMYKIA